MNKETKQYMSQEDKQMLIESLKMKWDYVNRRYQEITHKNKVDSEGLRRKKETCEKELAQIEKDLEKLNKIHCFIDYTN